MERERLIRILTEKVIEAARKLEREQLQGWHYKDLRGAEIDLDKARRELLRAYGVDA